MQWQQQQWQPPPPLNRWVAAPLPASAPALLPAPAPLPPPVVQRLAASPRAVCIQPKIRTISGYQLVAAPPALKPSGVDFANPPCSACRATPPDLCPPAAVVVAVFHVRPGPFRRTRVRSSPIASCTPTVSVAPPPTSAPGVPPRAPVRPSRRPFPATARVSCSNPPVRRNWTQGGTISWWGIWSSGRIRCTGEGG